MNDARIQSLRILWFGLFSGTVMFLVAGYFVTSQRPEQAAPEMLLLVVLTITAGAAAIGSIVLPPVLSKQAFLSLGLPTTTAPSPGPSNTRHYSKRFVDVSTARTRGLSAAQPAFIVGMALAEAVALHGFVLWFLGFQFAYALPFFVLCWVLMVGKFPRRDVFEAQLQQAYDADLI